MIYASHLDNLFITLFLFLFSLNVTGPACEFSAQHQKVPSCAAYKRQGENFRKEVHASEERQELGRLEGHMFEGSFLLGFEKDYKLKFLN